MQITAPKLITEANAWKGSDFANDTSWNITLNALQIAELEAAADACIARGIREIDITAKDFPLPTFAADIKAWAHEIVRDCGTRRRVVRRPTVYTND